jgi:biopolymer transport protein ExbB
MNMLRFKTIIGSVIALMALTLSAPAQQNAAAPAPSPSVSSPAQPPATAQAPAVAAESQKSAPSQPAATMQPAATSPPAAAAQPEATSSPTAASPPAAPSAEATSAPADGGGKSLKSASTTGGMHELSPWSMFLGADILVKGVMIGLAFFSLMTWTIAVSKTLELSLARRRLRVALYRIRDSKSLAEAQLASGTGKNMVVALLAVAVRETKLSAETFNDSGIKERAASSFAEIARAEARRVRFGMGMLATIGAISPFIGLFGTVWGIMNSFIGISKSQTTNLAVVAPGIAEALLATAIGLVAAIPAVIIYNHFARATKSYLELASLASGAAGRLLSRDLDYDYSSTRSHAAE